MTTFFNYSNKPVELSRAGEIDFKGEGPWKEGWRRYCCRLQNKQICLPQNADIYKTVPKVADFIFAGAIIL